jgi:hypothetical protein
MAEETKQEPKPTLPRPRKSGRPSRGTGVVATNLVNRYTNQSSAENNTNPTVSPKRGRTGITDISSSSTTTNTSNSSEQLVQINKTEQGLLSDIKKILKEHLNFVKRKSDVPRVQLVRKKKLIDDPMEKYTPSALLKRGLDAGKEKIKEKIFGKKTSGINKLAEKKQIGEMASDNGILKKVIPNIISTLGSSIGPLLMLMAKLLIGLIIIAGAAGLGMLLYNLLIKPTQDKEEKAAQERLATPTKKGEDVVTNTGEQVFEKTVNGPEGTKKVYVNESQKKKEIEALPEEQREQAETNYVPARIVTDIASGKQDTAASSGFELKQGMSIEQINAGVEKAKQKEEQKSPRLKTLEKYDAELQAFEANFKKRITRLITEISDNGGRPNETTEAELEAIQQDHASMIDRIKKDGNIMQQDKQMLLDSHGITQGGIENQPSFSGTFGKVGAFGEASGLAYILPNNKNIELSPSIFSRAGLARGIARQESIMTLGMSDAVEERLNESIAANRVNSIQTLEEATQSPDGGMSDRIKAIQKEESQRVKPAQPTAPSGDQLQNQAMQMRAPDMIAAPTPVAGGNTIINNYNTAPAKQPTLLSGGGGDNGGGSATPPDDSGMHAALTKDLSRSASMGNHT